MYNDALGDVRTVASDQHMVVNRLSRDVEPQFVDFLTRLVRSGTNKFFHPHEFSEAGARQIIALSEEKVDEYWVGVEDGRVIVYGMLRGWREGYDIPSLGLAVAPERRGAGLGRVMMGHLHLVARTRGAKRIRLTVHRRNDGAIKLYTSLGYRFQDHTDTALVGYLDLLDDA